MVTLEEENKQLRKRIAFLEEEQLGQQVADQKVKYAQAQVGRAESSDLLSREAWRARQKLIDMAVAELLKHDCSRSCDGTPEAALAILKTKV